MQGWPVWKRRRASFQQVDQRFGQVDQWFDRVEGDIRDLRSLNWWLWATTILAIVGLFVTVLLRT